jgi:hypothetical protein
MGTNLSQVFISNTANFQAPGGDNVTDLFTNLSTAEVGVWNVPGIAQATAGTNYWVDTKLFEKTFATSDTAGAGGSVNFANPAWKYNRLQFAQGTAGNPIATPIINTANIKRIKFDPYVVTAGHKVVLTPDGTFTAPAVNTVTIKVIVRSTPTDQLSFYDQNGSNAAILSGTAPFPLGAFNTTNHKVISVEFNCTTKATFTANGKVAIDSHGLLKDLITATDTGTGTSLDLQSKHVGFIFDVIVLDKDGNNILAASGSNKIAPTVTAQVLGVGNAWQVLGDEIKCRSRYGNFNRMYLPQNMPTYTNTTYQYHKVTIEYATNWPTSTGIAPAGATNQVVIYAADSATAMVVGDTNLDAIFNLAAFSAGVEYIWS